MLRFRAFLLALSLAVLAGFAACSGTGSSSSFFTITGIVVRAETLTTGRGCGVSPEQLFRYAVVVYGKNPTDEGFDIPIAGNVYDCFTDGTFVRLPEINGSFRYRLEVRAFNRPDYEAARATLAALPSIAPPIADDAGITPVVGSPAVDAFRATSATWTTECHATQLESVQSLAVCAPLAGATDGAQVVLETREFALEEGGVARCANAADAGTDAEADADVDGGAGDVTFTIVRARARTSSSVDAGAPQDVTCPTPYVESFGSEPQLVTIDAVLLSAGGAEVGRTTCTAETSAGATVTARCDPVR